MEPCAARVALPCLAACMIVDMRASSKLLEHPVASAQPPAQRRRSGKRYQMPQSVCVALEQVFGMAVDAVKVIEYSRYARAHWGAVATTRPGLILLAISGDEFLTNAELVLHEYFHVLRQWHSGRLNRFRYLFECARRGYWNNRFEVEAREFAASAVERYRSYMHKTLEPHQNP